MATRERILMISTHGYVAAEPELGMPDTGGQVVYVLELSESLARLGYDVDILTRQFEDQPEEERVNDRVRVVRIPCDGEKFIPKEHMHKVIPEWVRNVLRYTAERNLQYAFINSHYWDAGLAGQSLARQLDIPHAHTPHSIGAWKKQNMDGDPAELEKQYNFTTRIRKEKAVYDECDCIIATTAQQRDILRNSDYDVPDSKIFVVPPGYDDSRFFPVSVATHKTLRQQLGYEGRIVLALGRMARNKGYDLLVRAMPVVFDRIADAKLLLAVGSTHPTEEEDEQLAELKSIASELGIQDRIIYRDYIPDEELADYYRMADVFALSSRYEPFGMTAVEAMACGTPTVVTTEGGLWEEIIWGLEGLYADPFDPEAFGHAICAILTHDALYQQLSKFGSQKARANFTWNSVAQRIVQSLEKAPPRVRASLTDNEHHDVRSDIISEEQYRNLQPLVECTSRTSSSAT